MDNREYQLCCVLTFQLITSEKLSSYYDELFILARCPHSAEEGPRGKDKLPLTMSPPPTGLDTATSAQLYWKPHVKLFLFKTRNRFVSC